MVRKKNQIGVRSIGQKAIVDYLDAKLPEQAETIVKVDELPLTFQPGTIFTFGDINSTKFTHGFHAYPAKFVPQIPRWAINYSNLGPHDLILDPFCGCGTALVEACLKGFNSYGIDIDPLARLLTKVKCTPLYREKPNLLFKAFDDLIRKIRKERSPISLEEQSDVMLHYNWRYWFDEEIMKLLIRIKRGIRTFDPPSTQNEDEKQAVRDFFLICLSSIIKKVSYLDEEQIKVKRSKRKFKQGTRNPINAFEAACKRNIAGMIDFSVVMKQHTTLAAKIIGEDARSIKLGDKAVKLIVTSPPYINAIDYPFAHKHELFVLDLQNPKEYRPESRRYIGVSERVLLKAMYKDIHLCGYEPVDRYIEKIYSQGRDVDKNRAYIVFQYFNSMETFMDEASRVLSDDGRLVIFVGDNHIRKIYIPTHVLLMRMAEEKCKFKTETFFFHQLKKKRFGLPRYETGDQINREMAMVLRKD
jgi:DNA modification methylase